MPKLHLVRHGPTNKKGLIGWSDVPADLTDTKTIARLNEVLPDVPVIASTLQRATTTADAFANTRKRLPNHDALKEFNFGDWEGMTGAEAAERDPNLAKEYWSNPGDAAPPNGESWNSGATRFSAAIDELFDAHGDIIVVAHMGMILTQIARAARIDPSSALSFKIDNFSVTSLEKLDDTYWRIHCINQIL